MPLGAELRDARERAGLSIEQISNRARIELYEIVALENDSLTHLPDEEYLERLVLSYAAEVSLDAAPVMERVRIERQEFERDWETRRESFKTFEDGGPPIIPEIDVQAPEAVVETARPDTVHTMPVAKGRRRQNFLLPLMSALAVTGWTAYFVESGVFTREARSNDAPTSASTFEVPSNTVPASVVDAAAARPPALAKTISGRWTLETHVESAGIKRYTGLKRGYQIELNQNGDGVTGTGRRISQNAIAIPARMQTAVKLTGHFVGNQLILTFSEGSVSRGTRGTLEMRLDESGKLHGQFVNTTLRLAGTAEARKIP